MGYRAACVQKQAKRRAFARKFLQGFSLFCKLFAKLFQAFRQAFPRILLAVLSDFNGLQALRRDSGFLQVFHRRRRHATEPLDDASGPLRQGLSRIEPEDRSQSPMLVRLPRIPFFRKHFWRVRRTAPDSSAAAAQLPSSRGRTFINIRAGFADASLVKRGSVLK
jgi:hypothetical protein